MSTSFGELRAKLASFLQKKQRDQDLEAEMASHLEMAVEENIQLGMSPEEARRKALVRFGGMEQAKEEHRDARGSTGHGKHFAGFALHLPHAPAGCWIHNLRGVDHRVGNWREFNGVQRAEYAAGAAAAVSRSGQFSVDCQLKAEKATCPDKRCR